MRPGLTGALRQALAHRVRVLIAVGCAVAVAAVASIWLAYGGSTNSPGRAGHGDPPSRPGLGEPGGARTDGSLPPAEPAPGGRSVPPEAPAPGSRRDGSPGADPTGPGRTDPALPPRGSGGARPGNPVAPPPNLAPVPGQAPSAVRSENGTLATPADLFTRKDPPPDGVAAQIEGFSGGVDDAEPDPPTGGPGVTGPRYVEVPSSSLLRFWNFDPRAPLTVTVTGPGGLAETLVLDPSEPDDVFFLHRSYLPGQHAIGEHVVRARQGGRQASLTYTVRRAITRRLMIIEGNKAFLHLGGFPPDRPVTVHLYGDDADETLRGLLYRTSFTVPVDAMGEASVHLDVGPGRAEGCFGFTVAGRRDVSSPFCVQSRLSAQR